MAIFPVIECESVVQVGDVTRISGGRSVVSGTSVFEKVVIYPDGINPVTVTSVDGYYTDWVFETAGTYTVTLSFIIDEAMGTQVAATTTVTAVTEATDALLSTDNDLRTCESEIMNLLKAGRATFKDVHRRAKKLIIDQISLENVKNGTGNEITIEDIANTEALRDWSTYLALRLIFLDNSSSAEDRFERRSNYYKSYEDQAKAMAFASVKFDEDQDGNADSESPIGFTSIPLVRR